MLKKADLEQLAQVRLDDAMLLFRHDRSSSAYYLAGYAVELALKAVAATLFHSNAIPSKGIVNAIHTHRLEDLLTSVGLKQAHREEVARRPEFGAAWTVAARWTSESRYAAWDPNATESLIEAISNQDHGVFRWVKLHW